jgi:ribosomal protein S18 acetylase RimI-like enzyme
MEFAKIRQEEFNEYLKTAVSEYAQDKVKAGAWAKSEALQLAQHSFNELLPEGPQTKDNYVFSIYTSEVVEPIGLIWVKVMGQKGFIYDFMIKEKYRGQGFGKQALLEIEKWASEQGLAELGLHVFAHNQTAYGLYKKMGYLETDITMVRKIK